MDTQADTVEVRTYKVAGLNCIDCAGRIQASVKQLDGVVNCQVDYTTGDLTVWLTNPEFDITPISTIVKKTGHNLMTNRNVNREIHPAVHFIQFMLTSLETQLTLIAGFLILLAFGLYFVQSADWLSRIAFACAVAVGGWPILRNAYQEVGIAHILGINTLMVTAVTGAMIIGEWGEAAVVVFLFALGEALEGYATERARGALESMLDLVPAVALRFTADGTTEEMPIEEVVVGDLVLIRPGDRVSVDGIVVAGYSSVDQSAITGESIPVDKAPSSEVYAGTVNLSGALQVQVTKNVEDNTLNRMINLVQQAQSNHAPVQRFVDRFARVYTPVVTGIALLIAVIPPLFFNQAFWGTSGWLMRALQILVIACPCALVISTPVSIVSALTNAASRGVLVKGGRHLETLGRVNVVAFDKTGTLTRGEPATTDVLDVCADPTCKNGLQFAAAVESHTVHPLARALVAEAEAQKIAVLPAQEVNILKGHGVTGLVDQKKITVASHPYFDAKVPHSQLICQEADRLSAEGKTVMLVCHDDIICSIFAVADQTRVSSQQAIAELKSFGDIRTVILTGDNSKVAQAIGTEVGIDDIRAGLLPEEKVDAIQNLKKNSGIVAMVGDGVNDVPAMAQSDIGIAMGGASTEQAMETADVVLMGEDLRQLPFAIRLSRQTQRIVNSNIIFSLAIKALVFGLALTGFATLWMAIVADVGASLIVILNGMRLRKVR
jgi:Cd2+/Zn2+-exporting ATPase